MLKSDGPSQDLPPGYNPAAPLIETTNVPCCPICSEQERAPFAFGFDYEMETCSNRWQFWSCANCGAVWLDPRPSFAETETIYPPTYYAYSMSEKLSPFILRGKGVLDKLKLDAILKYLGRTPVSALDVGCGDGRYLWQLARRGVPRDSIYGIDMPGPGLLKLKREGFQIFTGRIEECTAIPPGSLDLISMFHVIEHLGNPRATLEQFNAWLRPGGLLALETPNIDSLDLKLFRTTMWGGYHIPRHWTLFSKSTLARALGKAGFEVLATRYQTGHSFWLYSFHHLLKYNSRWPMPALARRFDPMKSKAALIVFTAFDLFRRMLGARTSAMLVLARKMSV